MFRIAFWSDGLFVQSCVVLQCLCLFRCAVAHSCFLLLFRFVFSVQSVFLLKLFFLFRFVCSECLFVQIWCFVNAVSCCSELFFFSAQICLVVFGCSDMFLVQIVSCCSSVFLLVPCVYVKFLLFRLRLLFKFVPVVQNFFCLDFCCSECCLYYVQTCVLFILCCVQIVFLMFRCALFKFVLFRLIFSYVLICFLFRLFLFRFAIFVQSCFAQIFLQFKIVFCCCSNVFFVWYLFFFVFLFRFVVC